MKRIAITPEAIHPAEPDAICAILDHGWDMVHLRHPGADIKSLRYLLDRIPAALHTRIRLHSCFELTGEYQLGGFTSTLAIHSLPRIHRTYKPVMPCYQRTSAMRRV